MSIATFLKIENKCFRAVSTVRVLFEPKFSLFHTLGVHMNKRFNIMEEETKGTNKRKLWQSGKKLFFEPKINPIQSPWVRRRVSKKRERRNVFKLYAMNMRLYEMWIEINVFEISASRINLLWRTQVNGSKSAMARNTRRSIFEYQKRRLSPRPNVFFYCKIFHTYAKCDISWRGG